MHTETEEMQCLLSSNAQHLFSKGFAPMVCFICIIFFFYHKPILNILAVRINGRISITVDVNNTLVIDLCFGPEPRDFPLPLKNQ